MVELHNNIKTVPTELTYPNSHEQTDRTYFIYLLNVKGALIKAIIISTTLIIEVKVSHKSME